MVRRTLPETDLALLAWSLNFLTQISATPAVFGLTPEKVAAYATVHEDYAAAMAACDPAIRSQVATAAKNAARAALRTQARMLMSTVRGTPGVSDAQKIALGFALRGTASATPVPVAAPGIDVLAVSGWTVNVRLRDLSSSRRGRPDGASGATLFSYVGTEGQEPPTALSAWSFEANTGRTRTTVVFPHTLAPGSKVWITACWFNGSNRYGPAAVPVGVHLVGGSVSRAAA
jgi:hypothetical protein